jgi:hypothetical protein
MASSKINVNALHQRRSFAASGCMRLLGDSWLLVRIAICSSTRVVFFPVLSIELFDVHFIDCSRIKTPGIDVYSFWV